MRIKEVRVHRYGPLADFVLTEPGDFTLLFGPNESGKTLLLDAILRFLLQRQKEQALFWERDRVEHEPDGFVEIVRGDQDLRFPDGGSLSDVLDVQAEDLRNILVVRASDLHVQQGQQKEYYAALTDRLMGIHREPMRKITDKLLAIGRLTPTRHELSDAADYGSIGSRFQNSQQVLEDIAALKSEIGIEDLIELEKGLIDAEEEREKVQRDLTQLEEAEKRERYNSGQDLLAQFKESVGRSNDLPVITQADYNNWRDAENETDRANATIDEAKGDLEELEGELTQAKAEEEGARDNLTQLEAQETSVQNLRDDAHLYRRGLESDAGTSPLMAAAPRAVQLSAALLALALIGVITTPADGLLRLVAFIAALVFAVTGLLWLWSKRQEGKRERAWEELRLNAAELGIEAGSIEQLLQAAQQFSDDLERAKEELNKAANRGERIEGDIGSKRGTINGGEQAVEEAQRVLEKLQGEFRVSSLDDLDAIRNQRSDLEKQIGNIETQLEAAFGEATGPLEEKIESWGERVQELAEYADAAEEVKYDQARETQLQADREDLQSKIVQSRSELEDARSQLAEMARRANEALRPNQSLPGDTPEDLNVIQRELRAFVDRTQEGAALASKAIEILEDIQAEEEQKVKDLFGEDDLASQYFRSITGGAYQNVDYDPQSGELRAVRPSEEILSAYKLSTGTYDQLYLATRLSLADRLLGGEPGFLLLDDPFLTSDRNRLPRQLEILLELAEQAWQIVYFTVKEEVRVALGEWIDQGQVEEITLVPLVGSN